MTQANPLPTRDPLQPSQETTMQGVPGFFPQDLTQGQSDALLDYTDFCSWPVKIAQFKPAAAAPLVAQLLGMHVLRTGGTNDNGVVTETYQVTAPTASTPVDSLTAALAAPAAGFALLAPKDFGPVDQVWVLYLTNDVGFIQDHCNASAPCAVLAPIVPIPDCGGGGNGGGEETPPAAAPKKKAVWPWVAAAAGIGVLTTVALYEANKDR